ncbi:MAG TPA: hypothetical protein VMP38_02640 [Candidatus Acidoferrum sp.]|nr:hypothetical protein [Candidatus Acidoferrum sp.]
MAAGVTGEVDRVDRAVAIELRRTTICCGRATRQAAVPIRIIRLAAP